MSFLGAIIAFVLGVVVSFANYKINDRILKVKPDLVAAGTVVRQLFNVGYLAAVYFIVPHTPFSMIPALVEAVLQIAVGHIEGTSLPVGGAAVIRYSPATADSPVRSSSPI